MRRKYEGLKEDPEERPKIYNAANGDELDEDEEKLLEKLKKEHNEEEDEWDD